MIEEISLYLLRDQQKESSVHWKQLLEYHCRYSERVLDFPGKIYHSSGGRQDVQPSVEFVKKLECADATGFYDRVNRVREFPRHSQIGSLAHCSVGHYEVERAGDPSALVAFQNYLLKSNSLWNFVSGYR